MSNPEDSKGKRDIFRSLDGVTADHEARAVIYDARTEGHAGIQPAAFTEIHKDLGGDGATSGRDPADARVAQEKTQEEQIQEAEKKGYDRGILEAQNASKAEFEQSLLEARELLAQMETGFRNAEGSLSTEAVLLAMQIAEKVIRKSLGKDPAALAANVESFLGPVDKAQPVRIHCHPDSAESLRAQMGRVAERLQISEWVVEEDHELHAGDLLVSFGPATIDARVNHRLERIEQALYRELGLESHEGNIQ